MSSLYTMYDRVDPEVALRSRHMKRITERMRAGAMDILIYESIHIHRVESLHRK